MTAWTVRPQNQSDAEPCDAADLDAEQCRDLVAYLLDQHDVPARLTDIIAGQVAHAVREGQERRAAREAKASAR